MKQKKPAATKPEDGYTLHEPIVEYRVDRVRKGLEMGEFYMMIQTLGITEEKLAKMLGMSRATLHRRKKAYHLDVAESDRLVRYSRLMGRASAVFGSLESGRSWLLAPAITFNGEAPLNYADTELGARAVEDLLGRLEHGVFS